VAFTLVQNAGRYLSEDEVHAAFGELSKQPGLGDLANAEVATTGKPDDHRLEVTIPNQNVRKILLEPLAEQFKEVLEIKPRITIKERRPR